MPLSACVPFYRPVCQGPNPSEWIAQSVSPSADEGFPSSEDVLADRARGIGDVHSTYLRGAPVFG